MITAIVDPAKALQFAGSGKVAPIGAAVFVPQSRRLFLPGNSRRSSAIRRAGRVSGLVFGAVAPHLKTSPPNVSADRAIARSGRQNLFLLKDSG